jgi:hypothetical protein
MEPLHAKQAFLVITQAPHVGHVAAKPCRTAGSSSALATAFNKSYAHGHLGIFFRIVLHHTQVIHACPANDHDLKSIFHSPLFSFRYGLAPSYHFSPLHLQRCNNIHANGTRYGGRGYLDAKPGFRETDASPQEKFQLGTLINRDFAFKKSKNLIRSKLDPFKISISQP